ncbi:MAG: hypothetical protein IKS15_04310 [Opitutales bacterium]|nr:hypothetical protein [Opitutales bacterium]
MLEILIYLLVSIALKLALELAQMAEKNIASSNIKEAQFALGQLISFYKKYVKDYEKTEQLYKQYAPPLQRNRA